MIGAFGTAIKGLLKGLQNTTFGGCGDHAKYNIFENGQNIEKTPGALRRLTVTQTPEKDQRSMSNNINNILQNSV